MLKRILFAVAPLMLVACSVMADDSLLSKVASMDLNDTKIASAEVADVDDLGQTDVDALLGDDEESGEEAIAACFRRFGWGYGYRRATVVLPTLLPIVQLLQQLQLQLQLQLLPLVSLLHASDLLVLHPHLPQLLGMLVIETSETQFQLSREVETKSPVTRMIVVTGLFLI